MMRIVCSGMLSFALPVFLLSGCRSPGAPNGKLVEIWFHPQPGSGFMFSKPEVAGDVVLFGSPSGHVHARDVATGIPRWTTAVCGSGGPQGRRFAIGDGVVVVACSREAVGLNLANGSVNWRYEAPPDTTYDDLPGVMAGTHPVTNRSTVYIPAWGASVTALSIATGATQWVWRAGRLASDTAANVFRSGAHGVAVSGDTVFVTVGHFTNLHGGTSEALLVALDRSTGAELWKVVLPDNNSGGAISAPPVLVGDLAITLTQDGVMFAVRRSTGQIAWKYKSARHMFGTLAAPTIAGDTVYASMGDDQLTALRADNGTLIWSMPPLDATKDLLATERRIYVPRDGYLNIHDRATGVLVATGRVKTPDGGAFTTAASARGDQIFITSTDGAWSFREPE